MYIYYMGLEERSEGKEVGLFKEKIIIDDRLAINPESMLSLPLYAWLRLTNSLTPVYTKTCSILLCVEEESVHLSFEVISHNLQLIETSIEGFCCGHIVYITQCEDIVAPFLLKSVRISTEETRVISDLLQRDWIEVW